DNIFLVGYFSVLAYAITKKDLVDVKIIIQKSFSYIIITILVTISFLIAIYYSYLYANLYINNIIFLAIGLFWAFTALPLQKYLITTAKRTFIKGYYESKEIFNKISQKTTTSKTTKEVLRIVGDVLDHEINIEKIYIFQAEKDARGMIHSYKNISKGVTNYKFDFNHPLITNLYTKKGSILINSLKQEFYALDIEFLDDKLFTGGLILPIRSSHDLEGIIFLGQKSSGSRYNHEDLQLFETITYMLIAVLDRIKPYEKLEKEFNTNKKKLFDAELALGKEKQNQLQKAKEMAETANEFKSKFLAQMTHDLRTPLHVVIGTLDLLSRNLENLSKEDASKTIDIALKSGERQLTLVNDILDLSKLESGKMEVNFEPIILANFLADVKPQMTMLLKDKKVKYKLENKLLENTVIESDPRRLMQIIINLLSNAVKFTKEGDIKLEISKVPLAARSLSEVEVGELLTFAVSDTGIGMTEENAKKVFEPYIMVDNEAQKSVKGTGLGLSICKGFVAALGGEISVTSKPGKGSAFSFWIPFLKAEITAKEMQKQAKIDYSALKNKHILMCDDDVFNRMFAEMVLKDKIKYTIVDNGFKAIEETKKNKYDLIFMDIQMPEIDGIETLKEMRKLKVETPIVALTAQAMKGEKERLISLGFDDYFQKPFKEQDIIGFLGERLGE
ncbi:ATP-binding protein, partial [Candidatus Margulisiibacteriota bacterium]